MEILFTLIILCGLSTFYIWNNFTLLKILNKENIKWVKLNRFKKISSVPMIFVFLLCIIIDTVLLLPFIILLSKNSKVIEFLFQLIEEIETFIENN